MKPPSLIVVGLWIGSLSTPALSLTTTNTNRNSDTAPTRREFVNTAIVGASSGLLLNSPFDDPAWAADSNSNSNSNSNSKQLPFCVIGANGKTGTKCVQDILSRGIPVRASSRSGTYNEAAEETPQPNQWLLVPITCDVTVPSTVNAAVKGTQAVIFAASASKQGGTPSQVDNIGLVNVAKACIAYNIPHLVIVSSGGVSKPDSPIYKFLNVFGGIMEEKIKGEDTVRAMYATLDKANGDSQQGTPTYTIIRPGGLTEDPSRGVGAVELSQGDVKSGRISRYDLATLCVEASFYPQLTGCTTFECYDADTRKDLGSVGLGNLLKQTSKPSDVPAGTERRGNSYKALFTGLERDVV